jgi:hypothetical protein
VLQTWLAAHAEPVDIVVGVASSGGDVTAHAWIEPRTHAAEIATYREIHRMPTSMWPAAQMSGARLSS